MYCKTQLSRSYFTSGSLLMSPHLQFKPSYGRIWNQPPVRGFLMILNLFENVINSRHTVVVTSAVVKYTGGGGGRYHYKGKHIFSSVMWYTYLFNSNMRLRQFFFKNILSQFLSKLNMNDKGTSQSSRISL